MADGIEDRGEILLHVILDEELTAQPLHPDRQDGDLQEIALRHEPGKVGQKRIDQDHVQVAAVVADEQDRAVIGDIFPSDHIQLDAHGKLYEPEAGLYDPETGLLAKMRPFFPDQPLDTQDREREDQEDGGENDGKDGSNHGCPPISRSAVPRVLPKEYR